MKSWVGLGLILLVGCAPAVPGEDPSDTRVTKANFDLAEQWSVPRQIGRLGSPWAEPMWIPGRDAFFYQRGDGARTRLYYVDPVRRESRDLTANPSFRVLPAATRSSNLEIGNLHLAEGGDDVIFEVDGRNFRYTVSSDRFSEAGRDDDSRAGEAPGISSPDGSFRALARDWDLFLESVDKGLPEIRVTDDGAEHFEIADQSIQWSPDSRYVTFIREDWRQVEDLWLVNHYADPRPVLETFKWPMPGEPVERYSLWVYDVEARRLTRVDADRWQDQALAEPQWAPDSKSLYFTRMSRDWMSLDLCAADPSTGTCKPIIEERDHRQIITRLPFHVLDAGGEILWWSMGGGWGHYSLHDPQGRLISTVTSGDFHSGKVVHIDQDRRTLYFMGNAREPGENPYYHHLYRVNLDGSELRLLTPENAEHEVTMAATGRFLLDNFSRADTVPRAVVRDDDGAQIMDLGQADISSMVDAGWKPPEIFTAKAADGTTDLWGVIFKPFDFDPRRKYPVITYGYPGKETEFLPFKFCHNAWVTLVSTSLAQYGFIVVVAGNRGGTPERSYEYYNYGEDRLRDYPVADKKAVIEELGRRYDYLDLERVGILGQSSGGFMAAAAILLEPDFFKVAVAKAGNHDNNLYYHHWNERYGRVTQRMEGGRVVFESKTESNNQIVGNLKGRLLIVQGDMDLHVPPSLAYRLAHDLMMANKRYDMFVVPNGDHFWGDNMPYVHRYIELYFVENLMGDRRWSPDIFEPR